MAEDQQQQHLDADVTAAIAALLAGLIPVPSKRAALRSALLAAVPDASAQVLDTVARMVFYKPPQLRKNQQGLARDAARENLLLRAQYAINAARRLSTTPTLEEGLQAERSHSKQHREASSVRFQAARKVQKNAEEYGLVLGWYAVLDGATTPECRANHGKNFDVRNPPDRLPGTLHGGACRCKSGPPFENGEMLYG